MLVDVTRPVILNTSLVRRTLTPEWIRKVCFVSLGQSKVKIGDIQNVNGTNYLDYVNGSYELEARLKAFFTYSGNNKQCSIFELGDQPGINLENTYDNKLRYLREQDNWKDNDYYKFIYSNFFVYPNSVTEPDLNGTTLNLDFSSIKMGYNVTQELSITSNANTVNLELSTEAFSSVDASSYATLSAASVGDGSSPVLDQKVNIVSKEATGNIYLIITCQKQDSSEIRTVVPVSIGNGVVTSLGNAQTVYGDYTPRYLETNTDIINYWNSFNSFDEQQYKVYYEANRLEDNPATLKNYLNTLGVENWEINYYNWLAANETDFKNFMNLETLSQFCSTLAWYSPNYYSRWLIDNGTFSSDYSEKVNMLSNFIKNGKDRQYIFVLNKQLNTSSYLKNLIQQFDGINDGVYFFIDYRLSDFEGTTLPSYNLNIKQYYTDTPQDKSAVMFIDNGTNDEFTLSASVAGVFASNMFDISLTNPCSPFNYKVLSGFDFKEIPRNNKADLINKSFNFVDNIAGQTTFLNGRCKDQYPLDFWYQWDYLALTLDTNLKNLILNGANNPAYAVRYNQTGIDTIKARLLSTLNNAKLLGLIDAYSATLNPATNEMQDYDSIVCVPYSEYIATNPEDYQNEIYGGASFIVRIGRYIRQIIIQVNLV